MKKQTCPVCEQNFQGHLVWRLSSVIISRPSDEIDRVSRLILENQWKEAAKTMQIDIREDMRMYYIVKCPHDERFGLISVISELKLWSNDYIESSRIVPEEDTEAVLELADRNWTPLSAFHSKDTSTFLK